MQKLLVYNVGLLLSLLMSAVLAAEQEMSEEKQRSSQFATVLALTLPAHLLACSARYPELQPKIDTVWAFEPSTKAAPGELKSKLETCFRNKEVITQSQCQNMLGILLLVAKNKTWDAAQMQSFIDIVKVTNPVMKQETKACVQIAQ